MHNTMHMHSLNHGIVFHNARPTRIGRLRRRVDLGGICRRHPNKVLAGAHAVSTILNACASVYLAAIGLPVPMVFALHYVQTYVIGMPMHALTLHLSRLPRD